MQKIIPENEFKGFQNWLLKNPEAKGGHAELYNEYKKSIGLGKY